MKNQFQDQTIVKQQQLQQQQDHQKIACNRIHRGGKMCGMEAAYSMKLKRRNAFVLVEVKYGEEETRYYRNNNNNAATRIENTTMKRINSKYRFLKCISSNRRRSQSEFEEVLQLPAQHK
jgi:hypothetical protein